MKWLQKSSPLRGDGSANGVCRVAWGEFCEPSVEEGAQVFLRRWVRVVKSGSNNEAENFGIKIGGTHESLRLVFLIER